MSKSADPDLFALVKFVVDEARDVVSQRIEAGSYIPKISGWPTLSRLDSGFQAVHHSLIGSDKPDYQHLFTPGGSGYGEVSWRELNGAAPLIDYVRTRPELARRITIGDPAATAEPDARWFEIGVMLLPLSIMDRLIHMYGVSFSEGQTLDVYGELERGSLDERLPVELWVPLALTAFAEDVERVDLDATASVRRIPEGLQLARAPRHVIGGPVHDLVLQAASHALVLQHMWMPNENRWATPTNAPTFYPLNQIDALLDAMRMTVAVPTGYAQIFIRPLGWAHHYVADLPPVVEGATLRRYPPSFDDGGWSEPPSRAITGRELEAAAETHARLTDVADKLKLAARRLSSASLRAEEHDAIIDLCIGLEAALGDESKSDITFKLALRVAAVMAAAGAVEPPAYLFDATRKVYDYRSRVVHGNDPDRACVVKDSSGAEITTVESAEHLLRSCLKALLAEPRKPHEIDRDLVIRSLSLRVVGDEKQKPDAR